MNQEWYYWRNGEQRGPLTVEEMKIMLAEGGNRSFGSGLERFDAELGKGGEAA
jgi:hypothetical protein